MRNDGCRRFFPTRLTVMTTAGTGAAWVFTRTGGVWTQQGSKLVGTGSAGIPSQGLAVAISGDGNTIAIGWEDDGGDNVHLSGEPLPSSLTAMPS